MLSSGKRWGDFSLELWVQPFGMDNGEQILAWASSKRKASNSYLFQRIQCTASKNRFQWTFIDFFADALDETRTSITLIGTTPIVPKVWSHHLIRFDAATGLLEYLVNGKPEAVTYTTKSGKEGGEVYTPLIGQDGSLVLGGQFFGIIDELRLSQGFAGDSITGKNVKYPSTGGRVESRHIDLGEPDTHIVKVEAGTGRVTMTNKVKNEYSNNGTVRFGDESALQFFIRTSNLPYTWTTDWQPFVPGADLGEKYRGRYVQFAVQFYPSGDGEATPYLDEIRIIYRSNEPPLPPTLVTAIARNGAVDLSWKASPDIDTTGYFVYYGTASGVYFGESAILGSSPIDVGKRIGVHIDGLKNGVLYYFAVAAYDTPNHVGAFSREVTARPLVGSR
jgi:hypothetical protein